MAFYRTYIHCCIHPYVSTLVHPLSALPERAVLGKNPHCGLDVAVEVVVPDGVHHVAQILRQTFARRAMRTVVLVDAPRTMAELPDGLGPRPPDLRVGL